jgi:hypothetical protein
MNRYENQIAALMSKMTLDQMIGQMVQPERQFVTPEQVKAFHI